MADSCCNPFDIPGHGWSSRKKRLRPVQAWMCERAPHISTGSKICDNCRKKLSKESPSISETDSLPLECESPIQSDYPPEEDECYIQRSEAVFTLNKCLADIGETPFSHTKAQGKKYSRQKVEKITQAMKHTFISVETTDDGAEMIQQLKDKFRSTSQRSEQLQVLTVLPQSWSVKKIQHEFGVTNYMARKSKELVKEKFPSRPKTWPFTVARNC